MTDLQQLHDAISNADAKAAAVALARSAAKPASVG